MILILAICAGFVLVIGAVCLGCLWWSRQQDQVERAAAHREELARVMAANRESVQWKSPAAKGFQQRRKAS